MATSLASPSDVRIEIDTDLDDSDLSDLIARVFRDIEREYADTDGNFTTEDEDGNTVDLFLDDDHQRDFEAVLTAYRIAGGRDRRVESESVASVSATYEASEIAALRRRVSRLDPGEEFTSVASSGVVRDTDRHVRSAERDGED